MIEYVPVGVEVRILPIPTGQEFTGEPFLYRVSLLLAKSTVIE